MDRDARAFVLGVGTPNGLGAVRSLGREGVEVVAVDHDPKAPGLRSRYARPMVVPDPVSRPEAALEALLADRRDSRDLLFPTSASSWRSIIVSASPPDAYWTA